MNNVGRPGSAASAQTALLNQGTGYAARNVFDGARRDLGDGSGLQADLAEGEWLELDEGSADPDRATTGREAAFLRSFRAAARGAKRDGQGGDPHAQDEQAAEARVLATAQQPLWTGLPAPADAAPGSGARSPSTESIVDSVTEIIDRAMRAEMAPRPGTPLDLKIALGDATPGLTGLRITVTPTALDVILERTGPGLSEELVRAAEALAQRLMTRFSKKTVRVLDIASPREHAEEDSASAAADSPFSLLR